jgi:hypothetical protein
MFMARNFLVIAKTEYHADFQFYVEIDLINM